MHFGRRIAGSRGGRRGPPARAGGAPPPPWSPLDKSPSLWLKGDVGLTLSGSDVTAWADQSGNGRNATGTATRYPTKVAAALNGIDGVQFDGGALQQMTFAGVPVPTNGTVVAVQRSTAVGALGYNALIYAAASAPSVYVEHNTSHRPALQWSGAEQNPGPASLVDSAYHAARWMWGGTNLAYARDNASDTTVARAGLTASGTFVELGTGAGTVLNSFMRLVELIVFPSELTAGEVTSLNGYLHTRFGIW